MSKKAKQEELVKVVNGEIEVSKDVLERLQTFYLAKLKMDMLELEVKDAMLNAMKDNNIKSFENDMVKITYVQPSERSIVDKDKLKEHGIYDQYLKTSHVKETVKLSWK